MSGKTIPRVQHTVISYFGATDTGQLRDHNEDRFIIVDLSEVAEEDLGVVLMVADGMGGANAGEVASAIACNVIEDRFSRLQKPLPTHRDIEKYLKNLVWEAHQQIVLQATTNAAYEGMGTTVVIAWLLDEYLHVVWCGDSRCYLYQAHQQFTLTPFTDDHSLVWQMVQDGELTPEEARVHEQSNLILQVLGSPDAKPAPSYLSKRMDTEEYVLLCSDGLNGMLSDAQIQHTLEQGEELEACTQQLIRAANTAGGTDNITVILAQVKGIRDAPPPLEEKYHEIRPRLPWLLGLGVLLILLLCILLF